MAMAPVAYTIWSKFLRFDPDDPIWPNRDRFVLSMGHASMLLYSTLHLAGVKEVAGNYTIGDRDSVTMEDIKSFRQLYSRCAGHPEYVVANARVITPRSALFLTLNSQIRQISLDFRCRNHNWSTGKRSRNFGRDGHCQQVPGCHVQ
jgi:hypothetical protein